MWITRRGISTAAKDSYNKQSFLGQPTNKTVFHLSIRVGTTVVEQENLTGGIKVRRIDSFQACDKREVWQINRSANRLLILSTILDGFILVNYGRFAKLPPAETMFFISFRIYF